MPATMSLFNKEVNVSQHCQHQGLLMVHGPTLCHISVLAMSKTERLRGRIRMNDANHPPQLDGGSAATAHKSRV